MVDKSSKAVLSCTGNQVTNIMKRGDQYEKTLYVGTISKKSEQHVDH